MSLPDGFVDEIKARVSLSDLIGRTVALKRQGREFVGLSPFKQERSPSFFVNDQKGFYHCFSSQKHGDAISWLQENQGLSFMEAVETLAAEAGIPMPAPDPEAARREQQKKGLVEWMEQAQRFFARRLMRSEDASEARHYLKNRGLTDEDFERFGLGYSPDSRSALKDYLVSEGAKTDELVEAGLLIKPDDGGQPYDRFRGRVMFPIGDVRGRIIAFGGRALSKDVRAKYLNSPETPLFHKGNNLYRFDEARKAASSPQIKARGLIVAEGYMDVIAFARAGLGHAVAPLGTALTEDQIRLLWRAGGEPVVCLDGDAAGRNAAGLAAERSLPLLEPGKTLRFVFLPDNQDPDDYLNQHGAKALRDVIADSRPLIDVLWDRERSIEPLGDPDAKASFRKRVRALANRISDPDVKAEYKAELERRLARELGAGLLSRGRGGRKVNPLAGRATRETRATRQTERTHPIGRQLLLACIEWPELAAEEAERLAELPLGPLDRLRDSVLDAVSEEVLPDQDDMRRYLVEQGFVKQINNLAVDRGPMRAALGEEASLETRKDTWRRLATSYMDRIGQEARQAEERARLEGAIEGGDSDAIKRAVAEVRRDRIHKGAQ